MQIHSLDHIAIKPVTNYDWCTLKLLANYYFQKGERRTPNAIPVSPRLTQLVNLDRLLLLLLLLMLLTLTLPSVLHPFVRANCCNEITAKFSVCCIIKKFEKLLPKPGNSQCRVAAHAVPNTPRACQHLFWSWPTSYYKPAVMRRLQFLHDWQPNSPYRVRKQLLLLLLLLLLWLIPLAQNPP